MEKKKEAPRDYNADLRFDPPPEDATDVELESRAHRFIKAVLNGAGYRAKPKSKSPERRAG